MRVAKVHEYRMDSVENDPDEEIEIELEQTEYTDDLNIFDDPKETERFVVRLKYLIRKSFEYTQLMSFLKKSRGMYCCGVHNHITIWDGFSLNIHHTPLVMEDIIHVVVAKRLKTEESMKMSFIAKEVMMLHYLGLVGLYPLCETCHEYAHGDKNDLFIPLTAIFGDPEAFFEIYKDFISDTMQNKFDNIRQLNKGYNLIKTSIPDDLVKKYIYVTTKGSEVMSMNSLFEFINELNK